MSEPIIWQISYWAKLDKKKKNGYMISKLIAIVIVEIAKSI